MTAGAREALAVRLRGLRESVPDLEHLVLFGSAATGRARPRSDLDLAVLCDGPGDLDALYVALANRFRADRLDLVDLRRVGPLLASQIARAGLVLFERSAGLFRQFQSLASRRYADTHKLREAQRRAIQVFLHQEDVSPVDAAVIRRKLGRITESLAPPAPRLAQGVGTSGLEPSW